MNLLLIHGENEKLSEKRLFEIISSCRKNSWEIIRFTENLNFTFTQLLLNKSLFGGKRLIVVDSPNQIKEKDFEWLKINHQKYSENVVFYFNKDLEMSFLKNLPNTIKIEEYKLPKYIWNFLDSFFPTNAKAALNMLHKTLERESAEFVLALLSRHLSNLYIAKTDRVKERNMPPWKLTKLVNQAKKFEEGMLKNIISALAKADISSKIGRGQLADSLDILIAEKLG